MSTVYANQGLDLYELDLHQLIDGTATFLDDVGIMSALGTVYPDAYRIQLGDEQQSTFYGADLTVNDELQATGGSVLGYQETVRSGSGWTTRWGLEGFSVPILDLYAVAQTPDTGDDLAMLARVLGGNDQFRLSPQNDTADGYAGNDTLLGYGGDDWLWGNDGNDRLEGGDGGDTLHGGDGVDTLVGGGGGDTYFTDGRDVVIEAAAAPSEANDIVRATGSTTLGDQVEVLVLDGEEPIDGRGNDQRNWILGNGAANRLSGLSGDDSLDGGGGADRLDGGAGHDILDGDSGDDTMLGGAGDDRYWVDSAGDAVDESQPLAGGTDAVSAGVDFTLPDAVEQLTLTGTAAIAGNGNTGPNRIVGNGAANRLDGRDGNDQLLGQTGGDTLVGGTGNDRLEGGDDDDRLEGGAGADTLDGGNGRDELIGGGGDDELLGGSEGDRLEGGDGSDALDGGGGRDTLVGGDGGDRYTVDRSDDSVIETAAPVSAGRDGVFTAVAFTLPAEVEDLALLGSAAIGGTGNALGNTISGNAGANRLTGLGGPDSLSGGGGADVLDGGSGNDRLDGGAGADAMSGGSGSDRYVVDDPGDRVVESAASAVDIDHVSASLGFTLGANLEQLTLTGSLSIGGTGNALANRLTGNGAANRLAGAAGADTLIGGAGDDTLDGGSGADSMTGGAGNDRYTVDAGGDLVIEAAGGGTDQVDSRIGWRLGSQVENLRLTGSAAIDGSGNSLANRLEGNAAANRLDGGAGVDTLVGGAGDDRYVVDQARDLVVEAADAGSDTVSASVDWTLGTGLEHLLLTGGAPIYGVGNAAANQLRGNGAANELVGRAGNDTLDGGGGSDHLTGGSGRDSFRFTTAPDAAKNFDAVADFAPDIDRIELDDAVFRAVGPAGPLADAAFHAGTTATAAGQRILYDLETGRLCYDADGSGALAAVPFAEVVPGTALGADAFWIV
jgi:Ca2+-binding RTX toxin-like protein